jgi:hypothetical protein
MAKRKALKQLTDGVQGKIHVGFDHGTIGKHEVVIRPLPAIRNNQKSPRRQFKTTHDTSVERNVMAPSDKKRISSDLGEDWKKKVYGDVSKYEQARKTISNRNQKVSSLNKQERGLESQKGTPGAVDQALENRIQSLQAKEDSLKTRNDSARKTVRRGKKEFQRAAEKTYVEDKSKPKNKQQQVAGKMGDKMKVQMRGKMNLPTYRNPNSMANEKKRKSNIRKYVKQVQA